MKTWLQFILGFVFVILISVVITLIVSNPGDNNEKETLSFIGPMSYSEFETSHRNHEFEGGEIIRIIDDLTSIHYNSTIDVTYFKLENMSGDGFLHIDGNMTNRIQEGDMVTLIIEMVLDHFRADKIPSVHVVNLFKVNQID